MKRFLFIIIIFTTTASSMPIDSSIFKYYPLNAGNRWTWHIDRNFYMGPGYESLVILSTQVINNHLYYVGRYDSYLINSNQHSFWDTYYRIDSITGNLYSFDTTYSRDCLLDSLNSGIGDSALVGCTQTDWYKYDTSSYNFLSQHYFTKKFTMFFSHGWGYRKYAKNIGRVNQFGQVLMSQTISTLRGCIINGQIYGDTSIYVGINQISTEIPEKYELSQNYPNPFNPTTHIGIRIAEFGLVRIVVFDALGKEIQTLVNQELTPGTYEVDFPARTGGDGSNLPTGVYYYKLESGSLKETKKMVLIK